MAWVAYSTLENTRALADLKLNVGVLQPQSYEIVWCIETSLIPVGKGACLSLTSFYRY